MVNPRNDFHIHHYQHQVPQLPKIKNFDTGNEWVEIHPGKWKLVKKSPLRNVEGDENATKGS